MTIQMEPIPEPPPDGPRHVMTVDQFWERFIDMCQANDTRTREMFAALFGNDAEAAETLFLAGITGPEGLVAHLVRRIELLESRLEALEERS